uniref:Rab interacting lysosomal protein n=1 Tax=Anas zonorhyncha TaxID=75864 RepID=A0A8B9VF31_9AVES
MAEPPRGAEPLWRTPPGRLAPPHVYRMASALGAELRRLSGRFGPDAVAGLVPPVVRLLELLEALVAPAVPGSWELLTAIPPCLGADSTARKEREVMLRLKEVVDKQRDEIRAQAHEIVCKSRDTEALQEQLQRFMSMNEDLRHKVAVVQAQLKSGDEQEEQGSPLPDEEPQPRDASRSPAHCCFSKEELQQILQERNELKTNLFLVQEELAYYQRELLNEDRVPSFFLNAMKSTIKKQKRKIRAKMLGTAEESVQPAVPSERQNGIFRSAGVPPAPHSSFFLLLKMLLACAPGGSRTLCSHPASPGQPPPGELLPCSPLLGLTPCPAGPAWSPPCPQGPVGTAPGCAGGFVGLGTSPRQWLQVP